MTIQIEGYDDIQQIGEGGFSQVFRARQREFEREVAIKVLDVGLDERQREAFQRECRAMGVVSQHPNIVTVLSAAFTSDGRPAIVMELYGGGTYADRFKRQGALPALEVLELGIRICGALQTAHDRGLLHRDVKPHNLFLSDYGEPALGDFGISSFQGEETEVGGLTVHFAAPEVIEQQQASPACDVYSLAATLYTLVAGRRPFAVPGQQPQRRSDVALRVLRDAPPRIGGDCPPQLERAILQAMAKRPEDRPASAASFARVLQAAQEGIGTSRTEFAVAREPSGTDTEDLTIAAEALQEEGRTATVARPTTRRVEQEEEPGPQVGATRRRLSVVAGVVAVLALGGMAILGLGGSDDDAPEPEAAAPPVAADDDFFVRVEPPDDIELERLDAGTVVVTWSASDEASYQVQRVDGDTDDVVEVADGRVELDTPEGGRPCVVVRTIDPSGRISTDSSVTCLDSEG